MVLYSLICLASLIGAIVVFRSAGLSRELWTRLLPVIWAGLPILVTFGTHYLGKPSFAERYLLMCVPGLVLATSGFVAPLRRLALILPIVLILSVAGLYGVRNYYQIDYERIPEDYPELARFIGDNSAVGDAIVFYWSRMEIPYRYYLNRLPTRVQGPTAIYPVPRSVEPLRIEPLESSPRFETAGYSRIWFVVHRLATVRKDPEIEQVTTALEKDFSLEQVTGFRTWTVVLYVRDPSH